MRATQKLGAAVLLAHSVVSLSIPFPHLESQQKHNPILAARGELNATLDDYDYVVVGSGPGGGPTAANLAVAGFKVLLIDAGGDQGDALIESVPALNLASTAFAETEWAYYVSHHDDLAQQKRDSKMVYERADGTQYVGLTPPADAKPLGILYPRAGTLGGCSRHNALITIQAFDSDWDNIAQLTGDASWKADQMRKYFEKIEKVNYIPRSSSGHGHDGWLDTSLTSLLTVVKDLKLLSLIAASASAFGQTVPTSIIKTITGLAGVLSQDINAPGQLLKEGVYQIPLSIRDSKRGGARDWILEVANAVNRDGSRKYHLDLKLNTLATKILFDTSGAVPRATGVEFLEGKSLYRADRRSKTAAPAGSGRVAARREVIVAGGAFNTPQLLKLSGVGPRAELARFGIPVVVDLPGVGANLQDRYEQTVITESPTNFTLTDGCTFGTDPARDPCLRKWLDGGSVTAKGVYASNGIALGIIKKSSVAEGGDPDLIITGGPASFPGYYPGWADDAIAKHNVWSWIVLKGHTRNNAGTVTLRSTDPRDPPSIDFRSFAVGGDADLQAVAEGLEWARHATDSVVPLDGGFAETWPGRAAAASSAQLQSFTRDEAWGHHASCTCPIGADGDPKAVLDADFRVRGVAGLRVVDASVFPKIPGFYIAQPTYLVAEKASEAIIRAARAA